MRQYLYPIQSIHLAQVNTVSSALTSLQCNVYFTYSVVITVYNNAWNVMLHCGENWNVTFDKWLSCWKLLTVLKWIFKMHANSWLMHHILNRICYLFGKWIRNHVSSECTKLNARDNLTNLYGDWQWIRNTPFEITVQNEWLNIAYWTIGCWFIDYIWASCFSFLFFSFPLRFRWSLTNPISSL